MSPLPSEVLLNLSFFQRGIRSEDVTGGIAISQSELVLEGWHESSKSWGCNALGLILERHLLLIGRAYDELVRDKNIALRLNEERS